MPACLMSSGPSASAPPLTKEVTHHKPDESMITYSHAMGDVAGDAIGNVGHSLMGATIRTSTLRKHCTMFSTSGSDDNRSVFWAKFAVWTDLGRVLMRQLFFLAHITKSWSKQELQQNQQQASNATTDIDHHPFWAEH